MDQLQVFVNNKLREIRTVVKDGNPWFVAKDVADILGYSDTEAITRRLDSDQKGKITFTASGSVTGANSMAREFTIISEPGLYNAIFNSKKITSNAKKEMLDQFFPNKEYISSRAETEFIDSLSKVLAPMDLSIMSQYKVDKYFLDGYIEELNIAIEYDESGHSNKIEEDSTREEFIKKEINCCFVRVSNNDNILWNIGYVISKIIEKLKIAQINRSYR